MKNIILNWIHNDESFETSINLMQYINADMYQLTLENIIENIISNHFQNAYSANGGYGYFIESQDL